MDDSARAVAWPSKIFTGQDIGSDGRLLGAWAQLPLDDRLPAGWRTAVVKPAADYVARHKGYPQAAAKWAAMEGVGGANRGAIPAGALVGQKGYTMADLLADLKQGHVALERLGSEQEKHASQQSVVDHFRSYAAPAGLPFECRKIGHVVLMTRNLDQAVRFYTQVLGFKVSDVYPPSMVPGGMVFMRCGGATDHHGVGFVGVPDGTESQHIELNHMAFEVASIDEVVRAREHLKSHNVTIDFEGRRRAGCQVAVEFRDPDGHRLEIYWGLDQIGSDGRARAPEEWRQFFTLEDAIANPPPGQDTTVRDTALLKK
jgi:catechol 2,3-dioxygenase